MLIDEINKSNLVFDHKKKIKIYIAKIEKTVVEETKSNPQYAKYIEKDIISFSNS